MSRKGNCWDNAVAENYFKILKFLKEMAKYAWQLSNLVAFLRLNLFVKIDLHKWLDKPFDHPANRLRIQTQGVLFY
jgi:transposase InsO family protein